MQISVFGAFMIFGFIVFIISQVFFYKQELEKQNLKLFDFYLDRQFISKLVRLAKINNYYSFKESIDMIKSYYGADQILLYTYVHRYFIYPADYGYFALEQYLHNDQNSISDNIDDGGIFTNLIYLEGKACRIYVASFGLDKIMVFLFRQNFARQELIYALELIKEIISLSGYVTQNNAIE